MRRTVHYFHGCAWANGELQQADTEQSYNWYAVTCKNCLKNRPSPIILNDEQKAELKRITDEIIESVKRG